MKDSLRREYIEKRQSLDALFIENTASLFLDVFRNSILDDHEHIMSYFPIRNEAPVNLINSYILDSGRKLYVPSTDCDNRISAVELKDFKNISMGKYNIPEPGDKTIAGRECIDLILVPGVVFDKYGARLGYGKGCYDRFLSGTEAVRAGVCYGFQVSNQNLETEPHDRKMDYLLTEKVVIEVKNVI